MKIYIGYLEDGNYPEVSEIKAILKKNAIIEELPPFPRQGGGGVWIPYGLIIGLVVGYVGAGFFGEIGKDAYNNLKRLILEYLKKEDVFIQLRSEDLKKISIVFHFPAEHVGGAIPPLEINAMNGKALDLLPEDMKKIAKEIESKLLPLLHSDSYIAICKFDTVVNKWKIADIMSRRDI